MEYAIFPMKTISISQKYSTGHKAWDITGDSTLASNPSDWYAPCTLKVLALFHYEQAGDFYNTVLFGSSDSNGNPAEVMCEDGIARVLTFGCTHMDESGWKYFDYKIGKVFPTGVACYREGTVGVDIYNSHVHMDVGLGWQTARVKIDGQWQLENTTLPNGSTLIGNTFYQLKGFNSIGNAGANGYTFKEVTSRTTNDEPVNPNTGIYLQGVLGGFNIRSTVNGTGNPITTVPKGSKAEIIEFIPGFYKGTDNLYYQWAKVQYGTTTGYAQLDLYQDYKIVCDSTFDDVYLRAISNKPFNVRTAKVNGQVIGQVAAGGRIKLIAISSTHESDGYQWARVDYNGQVGFVQIDTVGYNQLEF